MITKVCDTKNNAKTKMGVNKPNKPLKYALYADEENPLYLRCS
jgi:hypothetical protein